MPLNGASHLLHGAQGRQHELVHRLPWRDLVGEDRHRRIGAHAAGVRALVAVEGALVVLRRGERDRGLAVAQREERDFLAGEKFLDHDLGAGRAEAAAEHHVDRGFGFGDRLRDHHALAEREPVGLDDDRRALRAHVGLGGRGGGEALIGGGRDAVFPAQVLGEALRAFEPRRGLGRAEGAKARGLDDRRRCRQPADCPARPPRNRPRASCRTPPPPRGR